MKSFHFMIFGLQKSKNKALAEEPEKETTIMISIIIHTPTVTVSALL